MTESGLVVNFEGRVKDGINREILHASGAEVGGILLGRHAGNETMVEDFEPVLCEHRFGSSYLLSEEDLRGLAESVEWFRGLPASQGGGLEVLGFYRSRSRPDSSWHERDEDVMRRFFAGSGSLLVLLKANQTFDAECFVLDDGRLRPAGAGRGATAGVETRPAERPTPLPPATRPRRLEPEEVPDRSWWWVAALVALTLVGAVLGYRSVESPPAAPPAKKPPTAEQSGRPTSSIPKSSPAIPKPAPDAASSVPLSMEEGIQSAIERWQHALLSGDPDLIAACYAPRLERYLDRPNSTSALVRQAAMRSVQQYGKPAILRISGLTILPVSPERAIATFRKHWQTGGPRVFAGEEQERLALVRVGEGPAPPWRIVSEEQTKVYWSQRPGTRGASGRR